MKSKEEIEQLAFLKYPRVINDPYNPMEDDNSYERKIWIDGYTQCQEDMQTLLNDLFSLWQSLAEVGEISVGKNFTKKYEELKNSLNKQD